MAKVRPTMGIHPIQTRSRSVGSVADTKLGGAVKGATLLQLASLSADAFKGLHGTYAHARATFWLQLG